jgi:hypothetical protein
MLAVGVAVIVAAIWLSFTLRVSDHLKYAIMMATGLVGVAVVKFARKLQAAASDDRDAQQR